MKKKTFAAGLTFVFWTSSLAFCAQEVSDPTHTKVAVMKHPKTGKPYVAILPENEEPKDALIFASGSPLPESEKSVARPDYRMLDWKVKNGEIPYSGPYSDRTKVYVLAATLATVGVVSGTAVALAIPATAATTATAASGAGAGVYAAAGTAIAAGTVSTALIQSKPDPNKDDFDHLSESKKISLDEALSQTKKG